MTTLTVLHWLGAALLVSALGAAVWMLMAYVDEHRTEAARKRWRERDWRETTRNDPRTSKRPTRRGRPGGFAA